MELAPLGQLARSVEVACMLDQQEMPGKRTPQAGRLGGTATK
jgi:hypothetical protein